MNYSLIANCEMLILVAILVVILFAFNVRNWVSRLINHLSYIYFLLFCACFLELTAFVVDGNPGLIWLNYLSNILYMASIGTISQQQMVYCNMHTPVKFWKTKRWHFIWNLPLYIELAALFTTPWTHFIFWVDQAGVYHRGSGFIVQTIPFFYLLATMVVGTHCFRHAQTQKDRHFYLALAGFAVPPFVLGGLQLLVPWNALDVMTFSIALSILLNYAVTQENKITRDTLTKLPNRALMDTVLVEKMKNESRASKNDKNHLYLLVGDLDNFKGINDSLGHLTGDKALVQAADVLYHVATKYKATAARFGGDEFVIILEVEDNAQVEEVIREIDRQLAIVSVNEDYKLRMSFGYTRYLPGETVQETFKKADQELYLVKKEHHSSR